MSPWQSKKQAAYMNAAAARGDVSQAMVDEGNAATKRKKGGFASLPKRAPKPKAKKRQR